MILLLAYYDIPIDCSKELLSVYFTLKKYP